MITYCGSAREFRRVPWLAWSLAEVIQVGPGRSGQIGLDAGRSMDSSCPATGGKAELSDTGRQEVACSVGFPSGPAAQGHQQTFWALVG